MTSPSQRAGIGQFPLSPGPGDRSQVLVASPGTVTAEVTTVSSALPAASLRFNSLHLIVGV